MNIKKDQKVTPQKSEIDANSQQPADRFNNQQKGQDKSSAANELAAKLKDTAVKELAAAIKKKIVASAFWSAVGPYIVPVLIGIIVILIIELGLALLLKGGKGYFGASASEPVSYASSTDMANMEMLLKDSVSVGGDLKSWYFSQNDKRWGSVVLPT